MQHNNDSPPSEKKPNPNPNSAESLCWHVKVLFFLHIDSSCSVEWRRPNIYFIAFTAFSCAFKVAVCILESFCFHLLICVVENLICIVALQ